MNPKIHLVDSKSDYVDLLIDIMQLLSIYLWITILRMKEKSTSSLIGELLSTEGERLTTLDCELSWGWKVNMVIITYATSTASISYPEPFN